MKNKRKYFVSLLNASNECVFSHVVSSRSSIEAVVSFVLSFSVSIGRDVYRRLEDSEFSVSCCPYVDSDSSTGYVKGR